MDAGSSSSSSSPEGSRSRYCPKHIETAVCSSTSSNRDTTERPSSSSQNERRGFGRRYREEHKGKVPYFTDARRERDRVQNMRKKNAETTKGSMSHRRRHTSSRSPHRRTNSRERRLRYREHTRSRSRSPVRYARRDHSRNTHTRATPEPSTRTPVYIPVPVPVAGYPYGYPWQPMRQAVRSSYHQQPYFFTPAPYYVHQRAPPPRPPFYRHPHSFTPRFRHFRPPPHNYH